MISIDEDKMVQEATKEEFSVVDKSEQYYIIGFLITEEVDDLNKEKDRLAK